MGLRLINDGQDSSIFRGEAHGAAFLSIGTICLLPPWSSVRIRNFVNSSQTAVKPSDPEAGSSWGIA